MDERFASVFEDELQLLIEEKKILNLQKNRRRKQALKF